MNDEFLHHFIMKNGIFRYNQISKGNLDASELIVKNLLFNPLMLKSKFRKVQI
jgi:hypothetical protein